MSDSYECDRCGTYYDEKNQLERNPVKAPFQFVDSETWDLCGVCYERFQEFMDGRELTPFDHITVEFESDRGDLHQPVGSLDTNCSFSTVMKPKKNILGDVDRADGALDKQVDGGYQNY